MDERPFNPEAADAHGLGVGSTEVDRQTLAVGAVRDLIAAEVAERSEAAALYRQHGRGEHADALDAEIAVIKEYGQRLA